MRDFHDQKDLFKSVLMWAENSESHKISWVDAQCYVIDVFLQYMALHGYILKKSETKEPICDIHETIKTHRNRRTEAFNNMLMNDTNKEKAE